MDNPERVVELLKTARHKTARGEYSAAIDAFTEVLRLDPTNEDARSGLEDAQASHGVTPPEVTRKEKPAMGWCPYCKQPLSYSFIQRHLGMGSSVRPPQAICPEHGWIASSDVLRDQTLPAKPAPIWTSCPDDRVREILKFLMGASEYAPHKPNEDLLRKTEAAYSYLAQSDLGGKQAIARALKDKIMLSSGVNSGQPWECAYFICCVSTVTMLLQSVGLQVEAKTLLESRMPIVLDTSWLRLGVSYWLNAYQALYPDSIPPANISAHVWAWQGIARQVLEEELARRETSEGNCSEKQPMKPES